MRHQYVSLLRLIVLVALVATGCEKKDALVGIVSSAPPVLSISTASPQLPSLAADGNKEAVAFTWTNPNYRFNTGISSHTVRYRLQVDTVGASFRSVNRGEVSFSGELAKTFTVVELNTLLSGANFMNLTPDRNYNFEARVVSSIGSGNGLELNSNVVRFAARPFSPPPAVLPPTANTLWATGNAFTSDWKNPLPAPFDVQQSFTRISNTLYELTVDMPGGGNYKLIQTQGNWGTQYHMIDGGTWEEGQFRQRDAEPGFIGPPTKGKYKITVNFQSGRFNVVKQ